MEVLSHAHARKKENAKEFQVSHFYWSFLSDTGAVKGLKKEGARFVCHCVCLCMHTCVFEVHVCMCLFSCVVCVLSQ